MQVLTMRLGELHLSNPQPNTMKNFEVRYPANLGICRIYGCIFAPGIEGPPKSQDGIEIREGESVIQLDLSHIAEGNDYAVFAYNEQGERVAQCSGKSRELNEINFLSLESK